MLDFTKCSLCGSCVEACRDGAIRYSHEYNLASTSKEEFVMDLFKRLEDEAKANPVPEAAQADAPSAAPASEASKAKAAKPAPPA
jgi:NADH-quinone oxidoreductase subunit I